MLCERRAGTIALNTRCLPARAGGNLDKSARSLEPKTTSQRLIPMKPTHVPLLALMLLAASCGSTQIDSGGTTSTTAAPTTTTTSTTTTEVNEYRKAFDAARAAWDASALADYDYTYTRNCFCPEEYRRPYEVSVRNGEVISATFKGTDLRDVPGVGAETYDEIIQTVDQVFDEIERALIEAASLHAEYEPEFGYPVDVYIDWIENVADEESGYQFANLAEATVYPDTCSTESWDEELVDQPDLPDAVAVTRAAIYEAAMSCDFDALKAISDQTENGVQTSFGGTSVELFWQGESRGDPLLRSLVEHLNLPYAANENVVGQTFFVWPSAFENMTTPYGDGISPEEYAALLEVYNVSELEEMWDGIGGYVGWRNGIAADGEWQFFIAGD